MRAAGLVVADTLAAAPRLGEAQGMTTADLDAIARESIAAAGATPSFLGYHGFPAVICTSVNDEIVHGIPGARVINDGDVVSIDCGAIVDGWHGDAAFSMVVGEGAADEVRRLLEVDRDALWRGIAQGGRRAVGSATSGMPSRRTSGQRATSGSSRSTWATASARRMHMDPSVPNYGQPGHGPKLDCRHGAGDRADGQPR